MDKTLAPFRVSGSFSALPIDVLLEVVPYTDVSSAIKMTLVGNSFSNPLSGPDEHYISISPRAAPLDFHISPPVATLSLVLVVAAQ